MINLFIAIIPLFLLSGCTYSIILTDTHGTATDVVDETSKPTADIDATANIPLSPLRFFNNT